MAVEYELKYRATPEILERVQADFPGDYTVTEMTTTYYDTPGNDLAKLFWTLRHRREGDKHICTLKTPPASTAAASMSGPARTSTRPSPTCPGSPAAMP